MSKRANPHNRSCRACVLSVSGHGDRDALLVSLHVATEERERERERERVPLVGEMAARGMCVCVGATESVDAMGGRAVLNRLRIKAHDGRQRLSSRM